MNLTPAMIPQKVPQNPARAMMKTGVRTLTEDLEHQTWARAIGRAGRRDMAVMPSR